jgi:hypothetical protein
MVFEKGLIASKNLYEFMNYPDFDTFKDLILQPHINQHFTIFTSLIWMTQAKKYYFCGTFLHKNKNRSGSTSVVLVDKSRNRFHEFKTTGVNSNKG